MMINFFLFLNKNLNFKNFDLFLKNSKLGHDFISKKKKFKNLKKITEIINI